MAVQGQIPLHERLSNLNNNPTPITMWGSDPEEKLKTLVEALSVAVEFDFMAREHAAKIWKKQLAQSGFDIPREMPFNKKESIE